MLGMDDLWASDRIRIIAAPRLPRVRQNPPTGNLPLVAK